MTSNWSKALKGQIHLNQKSGTPLFIIFNIIPFTREKEIHNNDFCCNERVFSRKQSKKINLPDEIRLQRIFFVQVDCFTVGSQTTE